MTQATLSLAEELELEQRRQVARRIIGASREHARERTCAHVAAALAARYGRSHVSRPAADGSRRVVGMLDDVELGVVIVSAAGIARGDLDLLASPSLEDVEGRLGDLVDELLEASS